jgi:hypothetical protein
VRWAVSLLLVVFIGAFGGPGAEAAEVHGSARVYAGPTKNDGEKTDVRNENYSIYLSQILAPRLRFRLTGLFNRFKSSPEGFDDFERKSDEPRLDVLYEASTFSALISYLDRRTRGTNPSDNFDVSAFIGQFSWQPHLGPSYSLRIRDESNAADVAIFGRDVDSQILNFDALYDRARWSARYSYGRTEVDNNLNQFSLVQDRHFIRANYDQRYWDDRLLLSMESWVGVTDQTEENPTGVFLGRPVPLREGLSAVDTTPAVGALNPAPGVVDGDTLAPAVPRIEIGGANTFRNIGVDLGITRPVTQLEITVDTVSDAALVWEVYQSSDNLTTSTWQQIAGVVSQYDGSFLRYTLTFPETTDRYFKAVNVSINTFPTVAVTEIRALVDVEQIGRRDAHATTYRAYVSAVVNPTERVHGTVSLGLTNDESLDAGRVSRDFQEISSIGTLGVDLTPELNLHVGYRFADIEEQLDPVLERTEWNYSAGLDWSPLPTVEGSFLLSRRDEREEGDLIRSSDTIRLRARTDLLPDLRLVSELIYNQIDDPLAGFEQSSWRIRETLQSRLTEDWRLDGGFSQAWFDSSGFIAIERRTIAHLRTTWMATPYLSWSGNWGLRKDDGQRDITQSYTLIWMPGPKLTVSLAYQDFDSDDIRRTKSKGANVNYRLGRSLTLFGSVARSEFEQVGIADSEITSARYGLTLVF